MTPRSQLAALSILVAVAVTAASCKKDDSQSTHKTKTELLTAGPWKRTALISNPAYDWYADGTFATDVLSVMKPCESDNLDIYKSNGTGETDEGPMKCDQSDPQTWPFTWAFTDNETKLVFYGTDVYNLVQLTETTLKLNSSFVENGVTYTHDETYGH